MTWPPDQQLLDLCANRRTLAHMKGHFATLLGLTSAIAFLGNNASAHPGHSATDVAAQLAAPVAGADHAVVFAVAAGLATLAVTRLGFYLVERRSEKRAMRRIRR